jgi:uncharacterized LabA/DUF88 family protein
MNESASRIGLFIDGPNMYYTMKSLGFDVDFRKFRAMFASQGELVKSLYYTALPENEKHEEVSIIRLIDWLQYNNYIVVSKMLKEYTNSETGVTRRKGNMDIEMTVDMLTLAPRLTDIVLCTGDGDFIPAIQAVQRLGCIVTVVSSIQGQPSTMADELRRQADYFVDLNDIKASVIREGRVVA